MSERFPGTIPRGITVLAASTTYLRLHLVFPLIAASVLLAWDASPDPDAALYRLYVGIQSLRAGNPALTGYSTQEAQFQVNGLDYGTDEDFFCVTAINLAGLESEYSNEVQYTPTPGMGTTK